MSNTKVVGLTLAAAAALAFTVIPATSFATGHTKVPCYSMNACKGKSSCKSATNACKAQNSCKGKGAPMMKMMSEKHCKKIGGSTTAPAGMEAPAAAPVTTEAPAS